MDPQQDWILIGGDNENGFTTLEFWRNWTTCDERDRDIEVSKELASLIMSSGCLLDLYGLMTQSCCCMQLL